MSDVASRLDAALEGRYRIRREIGRGGMATVYLADDLKHERQVALKVLKPEFAAAVGADRFLAEIKTTANLQHPHVLPLFDSGQADGFLFYVMPNVDGESLRERLDRDRQLSVDEAVKWATHIAGALDHAHRHGIVHRDIKPGNILLHEGEAMVADFGVALALQAEPGSRLTETGLSVGTLRYMSPEQVTGDGPVGPAADLHALGAVLYEMLCGRPPYQGTTPQAVLGSIVGGDPEPVRAVRPTVPLNVEAAVDRALEPVPADRFASGADFARALADPGFRHRETAGASVARGPGVWKPVALALAGLSAALLAFVALDRGGGEARPAEVERLTIPFAAGREPLQYHEESFTVSPDGRVLVYLPTGDRRLHVRRLRDLEAAAIPGSEDAIHPAISPDGTRVAFSQGGRIRVVSLDGTSARTPMDGMWPRWSRDGRLYASAPEGLVRTAPTGGAPVVVVPGREDEGTYVFVDEVSDGILLVINRGLGFDLVVQDRDTGERRTLRSGVGRSVGLLPSGHLAYLEDGALMVDGFEDGAMAGRPVAVLEDVRAFFLLESGRLVHTTTEIAPWEFVWVDRSGAEEELDPGWQHQPGGNNVGFDLSRNDTRLVFQHELDGNRDIWVKDLPSGEPRRLTYDGSVEFLPRWAPDERSVTFTSFRDPSRVGLWSIAADGTGAPRPLFSQTSVARGFWSPDGQWLVMRTTQGSEPPQARVRSQDIIGFRPGVDSVAVPLVATPEAEESDPELSPDGRWLAYRSDETGPEEIFVRPFPDVDRRQVQVSNEGGFAPLWGRGGSELFYVEPDTWSLVSVTFEASSVFRVLSRERLFTVPADVAIRGAGDSYEISRDDQRFLMVRQRGKPAGPGLRQDGSVFVFDNWLQDVEGRLSR